MVCCYSCFISGRLRTIFEVLSFMFASYDRPHNLNIKYPMTRDCDFLLEVVLCIYEHSLDCLVRWFFLLYYFFFYIREFSFRWCTIPINFVDEGIIKRVAYGSCWHTPIVVSYWIIITVLYSFERGSELEYNFLSVVSVPRGSFLAKKHVNTCIHSSFPLIARASREYSRHCRSLFKLQSIGNCRPISADQVSIWSEK